MGIKGKSYYWTIYDEIGHKACIETIKEYIDENLYNYLLFEQGRFKLKSSIPDAKITTIAEGMQIAAKAASRAGAKES